MASSTVTDEETPPVVPPPDKEEEEEEVVPEPLDLALHETLYACRASHGLRGRGEDIVDAKNYAEYRKFLSRRLYGLRQKLKLNVRGKGASKQFVAKPVTSQTCRSNDHVLLLAILGERAWATALEWKLRHRTKLVMGGKDDDEEDDEDDDDDDADGNAAGKAGPGAKEKKLPRRAAMRLRKAAKHSEETERIVSDVPEATDRLKKETSAMARYLSGLAKESKDDLAAALDAFFFFLVRVFSDNLYIQGFRVAVKLYAELAAGGAARQQDVFGTRAAEARAAAKRCEYALSVRGVSLVLDPSVALDGSDEKGAADAIVRASSEGDVFVEWCGACVAVPSSSDKLRRKLAAAGVKMLGAKEEDDDEASPLEEDVEQNAAQLSDAATAKRLQALDDAVKAMTAEEKHLEEKDGALFAGGERVEALRRDLELLRSRAQYEKLAIVAARVQVAVEERVEKWKAARLKHLASRLIVAQQTTGWCHPAESSSDIFSGPGADEVVRLYDSLARLNADAAALPGVSDAPDDSLSEALQAKDAAFQAYRCYYLAEAYAEASAATSGSHSKIRNADAAEALFDRAAYLSERATMEAEASADDDGAKRMVDLADTARAARVRFKALARLEREIMKRRQKRATLTSSTTTTIPLRPLVDRLDRHDLQDFSVSKKTSSSSSDTKTTTQKDTTTSASSSSSSKDHDPPFLIAHVPPRPKPMPCKPVLFDIAFNHLAFPLAEIDARAGIAPAAKPNHKQRRGGLFGWFSRGGGGGNRTT